MRSTLHGSRTPRTCDSSKPTLPIRSGTRRSSLAVMAISVGVVLVLTAATVAAAALRVVVDGAAGRSHLLSNALGRHYHPTLCQSTQQMTRLQAMLTAPQTTPALLAQVASRYGDDPGVVDGDVALTWAQLAGPRRRVGEGGGSTRHRGGRPGGHLGAELLGVGGGRPGSALGRCGAGADQHEVSGGGGGPSARAFAGTVAFTVGEFWAPTIWRCWATVARR